MIVMIILLLLYRKIYWAEAGVIKSSLDNGSDIKVLARDLGNITAISISHGNLLQHRVFSEVIPTHEF